MMQMCVFYSLQHDVPRVRSHRKRRCSRHDSDDVEAQLGTKYLL